MAIGRSRKRDMSGLSVAVKTEACLEGWEGMSPSKERRQDQGRLWFLSFLRWKILENSCILVDLMGTERERDYKCNFLERAAEENWDNSSILTIRQRTVVQMEGGLKFGVS